MYSYIFCIIASYSLDEILKNILEEHNKNQNFQKIYFNKIYLIFRGILLMF